MAWHPTRVVFSNSIEHPLVRCTGSGTDLQFGLPYRNTATSHHACSYSLSAMAILRCSRKPWWPILLKPRVCDVMQCQWVIDAPLHIRRTESSISPLQKPFSYKISLSIIYIKTPPVYNKIWTFTALQQWTLISQNTVIIHFVILSECSEAIMNILKLTEAHRNTC